MDLDSADDMSDHALSDQPKELIGLIGYSSSSRCGYCGVSGKSFSFYANATSLSPHFYQTLLDRCWRRSGKLLYRPDQKRSCCPHYTIRLDSTDFKPSKSQRQAANRFNQSIIGKLYQKEAARLWPRSREEAKRRDNEYIFTERIHEAEYERLKKPPQPQRRLEITLETNEFSEEKWKVFDNYQEKVHKEPPGQRTRSSFQSFLCNSPLRNEVMADSNGRERKLGSFHQCYRLDGELVAVGVLDLLPLCVSSVYFFYHESIHNLAPGKLGALQEIALALEGGYKWWYPGFYIHSCPKMRYKLDYSPAYMLDPASLQWDLVDPKLMELLDLKPFVSLSQERSQNAEEDSQEEATDVADNDGVAPSDEVSDDDEESSLFDKDMVGVPSQSDMEQVDLDHVALRIFPDAPNLETSDLRNWEGSTISSWPMRRAIAELVAAVGPDLKGEICIDFLKE